MTQDEYLQERNRERRITDVSGLTPTKADDRLYIWQGDITTLKCDAIVNACNSQMLGCFSALHSCVDKAAPISITHVYNKRMARCS